MAAADPNCEELYVTIPLDYEARATKIALGYQVASADLPHGRRLSIVATGRYVEVTISGRPGRVQIDLQAAIEKAALLLTGDQTADPDPTADDGYYCCTSCGHWLFCDQAPSSCENCRAANPSGPFATADEAGAKSEDALEAIADTSNRSPWERLLAGGWGA